MEIGVRELRNDTASVVNAVRAGERVVLTVNGEPVADVVPHGRRASHFDGTWLTEKLRTCSADPQLTADLNVLAGDTIADL